MSIQRNLLVGRQDEIDQLRAALDDATSGNGRLVMLVGEPGIGKTHVAREIASIAEQRGAQVWWGHCYEREGAPPFWPWVQPIRNYIQQTDPNKLSRYLGANAAVISELVPELREKLSNLDIPSVFEPEQARFRLFDSITTFLKNISEARPLILVLEDLHWADRPSLLLLEFLASELENSHLLVIGTYRDAELSRDHPLAHTLGELTRIRPFQRVTLRGLTEADVSEYLEFTHDTAPETELVTTIHRRSEGNPLYLTELVQLLDQGEDIAGERIPDGIREVIIRRLSRLSKDCDRALTMASIIGREFELEQLWGLVQDLSEDQLLEALEEALSIGIIEEVRDVAEGYQFSHALIQETLVGELSAARRVRIHARIAEALEKIYETDIKAHASELTYHFSESSPILGVEKLVHYSIIAGGQALAAYAWEDAKAHYEQALAAKDLQAMDAETASLVFGLGRALAPLGQHEAAAANLKRAFSYYTEVGDVVRALAAVEYPHNSYVLMALKDTLAQALDLVPAGSLESARLLCSYGYSVGVRGNGFAQGQEVLEESLAIARREGDVALERRVQSVSANVYGQNMKWQQCLERSLRVIELATRGEKDPSDEVRVHDWACNSFYINGDPTNAEKHLAGKFASAKSLRNVFTMEVSLWKKRVLAYLSGNWEAIHALGDNYSNGESKAVLAMALFQTNDFKKGAVYMDEVEVMEFGDHGGAVWSQVASCFCYVSGETDLLTKVEITAKDAIADPELSPLWVLEAQAALAQVAVLRHDASAAAEQYAALKPHRNTVTLTGANCVDRLLGLLSHAMGNLADALGHFEDSLAFCRKAEYRPELAWTRYDYANCLVIRDSLGDKEKAISLASEALELSRALGMRPLIERAIALKEELEPGHARRSRYPAALTKREVEVLRLVASGRSNAQIALELVLSIRTVERHISNIYIKTDSRARADATAFAFTHGLMESE